MKKQQNNSAKHETIVQEAIQKSDGKVTFLLKCMLILCIVVAVVAYTDKKEYFVGDQTNNHTERKWRSFYRFMEDRNEMLDIVAFGNSHASSGIDPYIVSMATGTYCFILNAPGSSAIDAYFNLKQILAQNAKPKIVILETACLIGEYGLEWGRIQSFEAKNGFWQKFKSMPYLFNPDQWVKAWSPTIRNHDFLLTDSARIAFNIANLGESKNPDKFALDLGRFSHGQTGLTDTMIAKYKKLGAPIKCAEVNFTEVNLVYLKKLYQLCSENGIELMFFTAPMYHKTFDNYSLLKKKNLDVFEKGLKYKWLDLQDSYDTTVYTTNEFNNEYSVLQHNTYSGMVLNSYKLSKFILDNYANILQNRENNPLWIKDFLFTDTDFAFNHDVVPAMTSYSVIAKNQDFGSFHVKEFVSKEETDSKIIILKLDNHSLLKDSIRTEVEIEVQNNRFYTPITLMSLKNASPPRHRAYIASIRKDIKVLRILKIQE